MCDNSASCVNLERRNAMLNELNNHLQEITSQNELLKSRLQRPYVGEFLKIDASAKSFVHLFICLLINLFLSLI